MSIANETDVIIVGGGPAGAALAIRLARTGVRVVLVERSGYDSLRPGESLAPAVTQLLRELGVWKAFENLAPLPSFGTRSIWGADGLQDHSHIQNSFGHGWHVERARFDSMMTREAGRAGARLKLCTSVKENSEGERNNWTISLQNSNRNNNVETLEARVLIDATGRPANVAKQLGAVRITFDRLVGVMALLESDHEHAERHILLETCEEGWWYTAPANPVNMVAMLMTDSDLCGNRQFYKHRSWSGLLENSVSSMRRLARVGPLNDLVTPRVFSAVSHRLDRHTDHRPWLAIGDAALSVDPVSGSGVVRALRCAELAEICVHRIFDGSTVEAIASYEAEIDHQCTQYLVERERYYAVERRWIDKPFWKRRSAAGVHAH